MESAENINQVKTDIKVNKDVNEVKIYVYVGPTITKYGLIKNTVFRGTLHDVLHFMKTAVAEQPEIKKFIVENTKIDTFNKRMKENTNLKKLYSELLRI